jgi:hypothetical protein
VASNTRFTVGDYLKVTLHNGSVLYGTALDTRGFTGLANFNLSVPIDTHGGHSDLSLNLNSVDVERLFDAEHARKMRP